MASFTTVITEFSDKENNRLYEVAGHTIQKPKLLNQRRKEASSPTGVAVNDLVVYYGTVDSNSDPIANRIALGANVRIPVNGLQADIDAALVTFRDFIASDEFTEIVNSQSYVQ